MDGDGYADVVVGAPQSDSVYLYYGGPTGLLPSAVVLAGKQGESFGAAVASAGDVNGDGYADLIVGATASTSAYVFHGGPNRLTASTPPDDSRTLDRPNFGISVASAGDVDGDGYCDVIIGADQDDSIAGNAFLFRGGNEGIAADPITLVRPDSTENFGLSVANAGDVNGDGYADVLVGAATAVAVGRTFLYLGGKGGLGSSVEVDIPTTDAINGFGICVAGVGDLNGDGYSDFAIASWGPVYVFLGNDGAGDGGSGLPATFSTTLGVSYSYGRCLAGGGDVNGDGFADVMVASPAYGGTVMLSYGGKEGISAITPAMLENPGAINDFGVSVAVVGDIDGNGYADLVVGAEMGNSGSGEAFLYLGGSSGPKPVSPALMDSTPDAAFGYSVANVEVLPLGLGKVSRSDAGRD
jgi:hypothetical protein